MKYLTEEQLQAVELLRNAEFSAEDGLPEPLFLLVSSLVPLPNVDLLLVDRHDRVLLSRRNDCFFPESWHIPGGIMRYGESFMHRLQETARRELGCEIAADETPLAVRSIFRGENPAQNHPRERGHGVSMLFRCYLPEGYEPLNAGKKERDNGYLRFFDKLPPDFLEIQHIYDDILSPWLEG